MGNMMDFYVGFAFYNKAIHGLVPRHLNFVIGVHPKTGEMLVVNLTTGKDGENGYWTTADWEKVERPSQLATGMARVVSREQMRALTRGHLIQATLDCPRHVLVHARDLFLSSKRGRTELKAFLKECL